MIEFKRYRLLLVGFMILLPVLVTPATAHHSESVFDITTPIVLKGTIVDVYFANPHSAIIIEITETDGSTERWAVENSSTLAQTYIRGYDRSNVIVGDAIEVCGYAPRPAFTNAAADAQPQSDRPRPPYWKDADKAITGRLLILPSGPGEHWSHYGPLDVCRELLGLSSQE
jgi:hypothetical protein